MNQRNYEMEALKIIKRIFKGNKEYFQNKTFGEKEDNEKYAFIWGLAENLVNEVVNDMHDKMAKEMWEELDEILEGEK